MVIWGRIVVGVAKSYCGGDHTIKSYSEDGKYILEETRRLFQCGAQSVCLPEKQAYVSLQKSPNGHRRVIIARRKEYLDEDHTTVLLKRATA